MYEIRYGGRFLGFGFHPNLQFVVFFFPPIQLTTFIHYEEKVKTTKLRDWVVNEFQLKFVVSALHTQNLWRILGRICVTGSIIPAWNAYPNSSATLVIISYCLHWSCVVGWFYCVHWNCIVVSRQVITGTMMRTTTVCSGDPPLFPTMEVIHTSLVGPRIEVIYSTPSKFSSFSSLKFVLLGDLGDLSMKRIPRQ